MGEANFTLNPCVPRIAYTPYTKMMENYYLNIEPKEEVSVSLTDVSSIIG